MYNAKTNRRKILSCKKVLCLMLVSIFSSYLFTFVQLYKNLSLHHDNLETNSRLEKMTDSHNPQQKVQRNLPFEILQESKNFESVPDPDPKTMNLMNANDYKINAFTTTNTTTNNNNANNDKNHNNNYTKNKRNQAKVFAFIFPQYHSDKLNDILWGSNFTDWVSLVNAPKFNRYGYRIPRPLSIEEGGLGYYDYTDSFIRRRQGELAIEHADLDGFVYHVYWFYDEKLGYGPTLGAPLEAMLKDGYPDVPFFFNWCAIKWQNTWNAQAKVDEDNGVLQMQYFPIDKPELIEMHYQWLRQFFHHPNYVKINGKPVLMLYQKKVGSYPVLEKLKELAMKDGFPGLYLTVGLTRPHSELLKVSDDAKHSIIRKRNIGLFDSYVTYPNPSDWNDNRTLTLPEWCVNALYKNGKFIKKHRREKELIGIMSSFDNTPRRGLENARLWSINTPNIVLQRFRQSLEAALLYETCCFPHEEEREDKIIIVNAMNEWAEGMMLEPSDVFGFKMLHQIKEAKKIVAKCQV